MPRYVYLTHLTRPATFEEATPAEAAAFGIVLFEADSEAAARAYMNEDPAIQAGVMTGELHPFRVALAGSIAPDRRG